MDHRTSPLRAKIGRPIMKLRSLRLGELSSENNRDVVFFPAPPS